MGFVGKYYMEKENTSKEINFSSVPILSGAKILSFFLDVKGLKIFWASLTRSMSKSVQMLHISYLYRLAK